MDLLKMHPMARKMEQAQKAFLSALESGDGNLAKQHLSEVQKLSDFLQDDLHSEITKSTNTIGAKDIFVNGAPVLKFQENGDKRQDSLVGQRLNGTVVSGRALSNFKPASGTMGIRRV